MLVQFKYAGAKTFSNWEETGQEGWSYVTSSLEKLSLRELDIYILAGGGSVASSSREMGTLVGCLSSEREKLEKEV